MRRSTLTPDAGRLGGMRGARAGVLEVAVVSCVTTFTVAMLPQLHFAYRRPQLHVALETGASLIALVAAALIAGRARRHAQVGDLALEGGLSALAAANLAPLLVLVATGKAPGDLMVWFALTGRSLGALLLATAALTPDRRLLRPMIPGVAGAAVLLLGALLSVAAWRVAGELTTARPGPQGLSGLNGRPTLLMLELASAAAYAVAAVGFLSRARRHGDELFGWFAMAAILAAAGHVNYFLYPSLLSQWVYTGDAFRLASYATILIGSMREISCYWHGLSRAAVTAERHRIARDLHDGVAQELAYLSRNLDTLNADSAAVTLARLRRAAERAESESRRAISMLAVPTGEGIGVTLAAAVIEIAERFGVALDLDLIDASRLPDVQAEALVRIACEAVTNAARHSGADRVSLRLQRAGSRVALQVSDTGCGFDAANGGSGFGLISMRERAHAAGGELRVSSAPGRGSLVEVTL